MISTIPRRWLAALLGLIALVVLVSALPVTPLAGSRQATAQAAVASGDVVFVGYDDATSSINQIKLRKASDSSVTVLATLSPYTVKADPDVSADGSRIVYSDKVIYDTSHGGSGIWAMKSDGSGRTQLTFPDLDSGVPALKFEDYVPRWSPDGTKIAFIRKQLVSGNWQYHLYTMNADGSDVTNLTPGATVSSDDAPSWSPDGSHIAYVRYSSYGYPQLTVIEADGDNSHNVTDEYSCTGYPGRPDWSHDGTRIYYLGGCYGVDKLLYITSTDGFATAANSTEHVLVTHGTISSVRVSDDGSNVYFHASGSSSLWKVNTSSSTKTQLTSNNSWDPDPVGANWPNGSTQTIVALGDSVAAGEGILYGYLWDSINGKWVKTGASDPNWFTTTPATDNDYEVCHQSGQGYPNLLALNGGNYQVYNMACTGSSAMDGVLNGVTNKVDPDDSSTTSVTAQLGGSSGNKYDSHNPDVVTLTLGANDINFVDWLTTCYGGATECNTTANTTTLSGQLNDAKTNLRSVLANLNNRVPNGKTVHVLVTNYYDPFPSGAVLSSCIDTGADVLSGTYPHIGLTTAEKVWLQSGLGDLNSNIADEVTYAQNNRPNLDVDLVDVSGVMLGHELCTSDPWVYGPSINYPTIGGPASTPAPFHPTLAGQRAISAAVEAAITAP